MRDEKRKEKQLLEQAYHKVQESIGLGHGAQTASIGAKGPIFVGDEIADVDVEAEECGHRPETDIEGIAAAAIAAIYELATAAGANLSVDVTTAPEVVDEVEVVDQFNTGYEDVGGT